jgi:hypothetical protein
MASVSEIKASRRRRRTLDTHGDSDVRTWKARYYASEVDAEAAVLSAAPATIDSKPIIDRTTIELYAGRLYIVELLYGKLALDPEFQFDIQGRSAKRYAPLAMRQSEPSTFPEPELIHDNGDGTAEGVDVIDSDYGFTERYWFAPAAVDAAYKATLFESVGKIIDRSWRGFQAEEVLFLGVSGTKRGSDYWQLDFRFHARPTTDNLTFDLLDGTVTIDEKKGHDYVWFTMEPQMDDDAKRTVAKRKAVHVGRVYEQFNPLLLNIGS